MVGLLRWTKRQARFGFVIAEYPMTTGYPSHSKPRHDLSSGRSFRCLYRDDKSVGISFQCSAFNGHIVDRYVDVIHHACHGYQADIAVEKLAYDVLPILPSVPLIDTLQPDDCTIVPCRIHDVANDE